MEVFNYYCVWTTPKKYLHSAFKCRPLQMRPVKSNLRSWNVCFCWLTLNSTGERHISTFEVSRLNKRNKCIFFTFNLHRQFFWSTIKFTRLHYVTEKSAKSAARWKKTIFLFMYFADIHEENFTKREKKQECILYYFVINVVIFVRR